MLLLAKLDMTSRMEEVWGGVWGVGGWGADGREGGEGVVESSMDIEGWEEGPRDRNMGRL